MKKIHLIVVFLIISANAASSQTSPINYIAKFQKDVWIWRPNAKYKTDWDGNQECGKVIVFNKLSKPSAFVGLAYEVVACGKIGLVDINKLRLTENEMLIIEAWQDDGREQRLMQALHFDSATTSKFMESTDPEVMKYLEKKKADSIQMAKKLKIILAKNPNKPSRRASLEGNQVSIFQTVHGCECYTAFRVGESDTSYLINNKTDLVNIFLTTGIEEKEVRDFDYSINFKAPGNILTENARGLVVLSKDKLYRFPDNSVEVEMGDNGKYIYKSYISSRYSKDVFRILLGGISAFKVYAFEAKVEPEFKRCISSLLFGDRKEFR